ncbi:MAG TPA: histidinol-phosphate transaminase [Actinomycetes bacterium]|nr:histidinol-phosphate transaminase [Actinomycetes bacterium]
MGLADLPLREDLRGETPYGAPQLDVSVRLNTNENPFAPSPEVAGSIAARVAEVVTGLNRYPDRDAQGLREALATYASERTGAPLSAADVWPANGSNEVLQQLLQAFGGPGRRAIGFEPSYSMHRLICRGTGTHYVACGRQDDFALTPQGVALAVGQEEADVVFVCTPNNPTGTAVSLEVIEAAYDATSGVVIVDEAYAEFSDWPSAVTLLPGRERLVVVRTLSKALELAGARIGYAVANPSVIDALQLVRLPYHLSSVTQAVGLAALDHTNELLQWVDELKRQRDRIASTLVELGYVVLPSEANFVFFGGLGDQTRLWNALVESSVLIRDVGVPGHLRVTAGTPEETDAFLAAITTLTKETTA